MLLLLLDLHLLFLLYSFAPYLALLLLYSYLLFDLLVIFFKFVVYLGSCIFISFNIFLVLNPDHGLFKTPSVRIYLCLSLQVNMLWVFVRIFTVSRLIL